MTSLDDDEVKLMLPKAQWNILIDTAVLAADHLPEGAVPDLIKALEQAKHLITDPQSPDVEADKSLRGAAAVKAPGAPENFSHPLGPVALALYRGVAGTGSSGGSRGWAGRGQRYVNGPPAGRRDERLGRQALLHGPPEADGRAGEARGRAKARFRRPPDALRSRGRHLRPGPAVHHPHGDLDGKS